MGETSKKIAVLASVLGAVSILIGAFGAHALQKMVSADAVASFETAVRYQMYHVFALLVVALVPSINDKAKKLTARLFGLGILLFSGSIYLLTLKEYVFFDVKKIAFVTPIGGLVFVIAWVYLAFAIKQSNK